MSLSNYYGDWKDTVDKQVTERYMKNWMRITTSLFRLPFIDYVEMKPTAYNKKPEDKEFTIFPGTFGNDLLMQLSMHVAGLDKLPQMSYHVVGHIPYDSLYKRLSREEVDSMRAMQLVTSTIKYEAVQKAYWHTILPEYSSAHEHTLQDAKVLEHINRFKYANDPTEGVFRFEAGINIGRSEI